MIDQISPKVGIDKFSIVEIRSEIYSSEKSEKLKDICISDLTEEGILFTD